MINELTYQGEVYKQITRNGMYYATESGKVLSLHKGKQTFLMPYQRIGCKQKMYYLSLRGNKKRNQVRLPRIIYAVRKGVLLEDLEPGKVYYVDDNNRARCASREAFAKWIHRYDKAKVIHDPADRVAELIANLRLQEQYHHDRDIRPLQRKLEAMKPSLLLYARACIVGERDTAEELVGEAVSMFLSAVCARKVIVADLMGYLKGILRNYRTKRRKLMQCSLPDEERFYPESLDEWE